MGIKLGIKIKDVITQNRKTIILTFEIFWIIVFIIAKLTVASSVAIPEFIYVNF